MIKFRCPRCGQKIAVNDEGAGAIIACPTCAQSIVVPPETAEEFRQPAAPRPMPMTLDVPSGNQSGPPQRALELESHNDAAALALVRLGVLPHLARLMMNKLVQALLFQRRHLMETQENATLQVEDLERRLDALQQRLDRRLQTYERRIAELQAELAVMRQENGELASANMRLARRAVDLERLKQAVEAESRDADLLLRA